MATPEFISLQCDHCGGVLASVEPLPSIPRRPNLWVAVYPNDPDEPFMFVNHSEAYFHGRAAGWYIAELELCPTCAEAYAIEKASEETTNG